MFKDLKQIYVGFRSSRDLPREASVREASAMAASAVDDKSRKAREDKRARVTYALALRKTFPHRAFLSLCLTQTHVDPGIARGVAKVAGRQNAPLRDAAEVCVSADTTSRCVQVYLPADSGEQSVEASRSRQHT